MSAQQSPPGLPDSSLAGEVALRACRLLRHWSAGAAPEDDCTPALLWLESERAALAPALLTSLVEGFQLYRRDVWLQYATAEGTVWGRWSGSELERPVYEVALPPTPANTHLRLRRQAPLGADEILNFLTALAAAEEIGKLGRKGDALRGVTMDLLHQAIARAAEAEASRDGLLGPLQRLHQRYRGDQARAAVERRLALLDQPAPSGLLDCLRQLLSPTGDVEGCLMPASEMRLFRQLPLVVAPFVPAPVFASAQATIGALRAWVTTDQPASLRQLCANLDRLGTFALQVGAVVAGPSAGTHRRWARCVLDNFSRLGLVARCLLGEPAAEAEPLPPPPPLQGEGEKTLLAPPPLAGEGAGGRGSPTPEPEPPPLSPEDAALAELAAAHPAAETFQALGRLAEELLQAVGGNWAEAEEAVKGLHYPGSRFKQKLLRFGQVPAEEQGRLIREAARQLADEFVNKIRRLDALLPGVGSQPPVRGPAHLSAQVREQLAQQIKAVRDRVFQIMRAYGGYEEYPVAVGESVRKHGQVLDDVAYVSNPRLRPDEIVQILEPGYVRRREDGKQELIRSPRVLVAR
ncbi:MAG: hypothetical protein L0Z62_45095 [Gemmataceae bacterium]|nr:hypothetical protein [Gemmataceae bacterium]